MQRVGVRYQLKQMDVGSTAHLTSIWLGVGLVDLLQSLHGFGWTNAVKISRQMS